MEDDSFKLRVDKIFGSLTKTPSASSSSRRSLWSLTDEEVEKKEWNRERGDTIDREENPCSSSFDGFSSKDRIRKRKNPRKLLEDDLGDLDDDEEEEDEERGDEGLKNQGGEEWDIRSSIGLDCTLDNEDEEDEFDKVAVGSENAGDRVYMSDVTDYGPYLNAHNVVPESFKEHNRDPRADLLAARIRLKAEDEEVVGTFGSNNKMLTAVDSQLTEESLHDLKPILKRKENQSDARSKKRVRFDPECKNKSDDELENGQDSMMVNSSVEPCTNEDDSSLSPQVSHAVPDYVLNPSKYTRYTFDADNEVDEVSNRRAYMDFLDTIRKAKGTESHEEASSAVLPKSITFTPKKKTGEAATTKNSYKTKQNQEEAPNEPISRGGFPLSVPAIEAQENEACAMEEDEPEIVTANKSGSSQKPGRQYRSKARDSDDDWLLLTE